MILYENTFAKDPHIDLTGAKKYLFRATDWIMVVVRISEKSENVFLLLLLLTSFMDANIIHWKTTGMDNYGTGHTKYLRCYGLFVFNTPHVVMCHSCPSQLSSTHLPVTLNDQMCCSCPMGLRAASQGPKLITEYNGKLWLLHTAHRPFHAWQVFQPVMLWQINTLSCTKMDSIDQLNYGYFITLWKERCGA